MDIKRYAEMQDITDKTTKAINRLFSYDSTDLTIGIRVNGHITEFRPNQKLLIEYLKGERSIADDVKEQMIKKEFKSIEDKFNPDDF